MTVEAIKAEIAKLSPPERSTLALWLAEREEEPWDEQIRADHRAGKLDALIHRAEKEHDEGTIRELP